MHSIYAPVPLRNRYNPIKMGPTCDPPMDWAYLLDPANGGPGEPPGREKLLADMRANPKQPKPKPKRSRSRTAKPAAFPSAKHASVD